MKKIGYNYFITQKINNQCNHFIFKLKLLEDYYNKIEIKKIDEISFINKLPDNFNIQKEKSYLFIFIEELLEFYKNYNSLVKLKFDHDNSMNVFLKSTNQVFKDKIFISKLNVISAISFNNVDKDGIFETSMLSENYNDLINLYYFLGESEKTYIFSGNSTEKFEMIPCGNNKILYFNIILGNIDFYEVFDLSENKTEKKNNEIIGLNELKNKSMILKLIINSYSIYEIFYQNYNKKNHFIGKNSKMLYFSKYVNYSVYPIIENIKILLKLLNPSSELSLYCKEEKIKLDSKNVFIEMANFDKIEIEGNNSLVYFLIPLTNNSDYIISNSNNKEINNSKEIFILPEKNNYDIINLILTVTESEKDEVVLYYFVDYNIIPYSRNKIDLMSKIILKKNKKEFILINNYLKDNQINHLINETFYIFLSFKNNINLNYELKYTNYQILKENHKIMITPGHNKIYIGYQNNNFLKFDKCGKENISLDIYQNEEINQSNIIISENDLISCSKSDEEGYISLEIDSKENFLLSLLHDNISALNNIIYNYDFELSLDEKNNIVITYYPISNFPQVEYHIFINDQKYFNNLTNHCFINRYINEIYIKKFMFLSNGEEEIFSQQLNLNGGIKCNEVYSFLIVAKEIINDYPNYHYYNPKNFFINENICNTNIIKQNLNYYILGTDRFFYDINNKKISFNFYLAAFTEDLFPDNIILYLIVNYRSGSRNLENIENNSETINSTCKLKDNEIANQIKYECEYNINAENISSVKSLDIIEINSQKIEIQNLSFLHLLNKNNIQNIKEDVFNKPLYFLKDSIINSNSKEFNITGNLKEDNFNYTDLFLQFHSDINNSKIQHSNCNMIKLKEDDNYALRCIPDNYIDSEIIDGYSNFEEGHLFVIFHYKKNKIEMEPIIPRKIDKSSSGLSTWAILLIILSVCVFLIAGVIVLKKKKKKRVNKNNEITNNPVLMKTFSSTNN